jgi:phosphinothricin acetyltransferase
MGIGYSIVVIYLKFTFNKKTGGNGSNMELRIREMKDTDWEAIGSIYREGIETNIATFQREVPTFEEWDRSHIKACRMVAEENGQVVGWVALSAVSSRCVYSGVAEVSIYIKAECRGRGIGVKLLQYVIEASEKEGFWTLQSGIIESNKASIALHKKAGFRMIGYRERIAKDHHGEWQNTVLMERRSPLF